METENNLPTEAGKKKYGFVLFIVLLLGFLVYLGKGYFSEKPGVVIDDSSKTVVIDSVKIDTNKIK